MSWPRGGMNGHQRGVQKVSIMDAEAIFDLVWLILALLRDMQIDPTDPTDPTDPKYLGDRPWRRHKRNGDA